MYEKECKAKALEIKQLKQNLEDLKLSEESTKLSEVRQTFFYRFFKSKSCQYFDILEFKYNHLVKKIKVLWNAADYLPIKCQ